MTSSLGRYAVIGCKLKQNANEGCNSCASLAGLILCFVACYILFVISPPLDAAVDVDKYVAVGNMTPLRCAIAGVHHGGLGRGARPLLNIL